METKRPFARIAGWAAWWLSVAALLLFLLSVVAEPVLDTLPAAYAMVGSTVLSLGLFLCVVASLVCSVVALFGMATHGKKGILKPAVGGLTLAGLMLVPILFGLANGISGHARLVQAREVKPNEPLTATPAKK